MVEGLPSHVKLLLSQSPSTSPLLGYDAVSVPALIPVQHAQKRSTANKPTCRHEGCALQRISQKCARRMCRQHCLLKGGCDTHQLPLSQPPAVLLQPGAPSFTAFAPVTSRGPFDPFGDQDKASSSSQPVFTFTDEDLNAPPPSPNFYQPLRAPPSPLGYSTLPTIAATFIHQIRQLPILCHTSRQALPHHLHLGENTAIAGCSG